MTKQLLEWPFGRNAIGMDELFDRLQHTAQAASQSYPPYNIIQTDEDTFKVELAVAGFTQDDITITVEDGSLTITGEKVEVEKEGTEYIHKGISSKSFERTFTLGEHIFVDGANMRDGLLNIVCKRLVPEEKKPKTITIS